MTITRPDPDGVTIRRAERADVLAVVHIESASFDEPWPANAFEAFLGEPGFVVAVDPDGPIVGYAVADVTATHGGPLGHLKDIAVHPDRRGEGIATALLERVLFVLYRGGAGTVKLEVRESNEPAISLYRRFGFESLRRTEGYYADGEDAIVMIRDLR
ncbi:ribosomal protein S18-alanine N-acetyltransferase [Halovivax gelatinilyticus]|uniref:ribosomal protein S18-alanine N-acetyltransferase n=1 Tax=Halovivax gelatinilyticus TaxID=2961597 RepID=UPI0020CA7599|nr:ribosomal protein S18-alanine N-acetyltransferase [Halovivax gelatinilyticus]